MSPCLHAIILASTQSHDCKYRIVLIVFMLTFVFYNNEDPYLGTIVTGILIGIVHIRKSTAYVDHTRVIPYYKGSILMLKYLLVHRSIILQAFPCIS